MVDVEESLKLMDVVAMPKKQNQATKADAGKKRCSKAEPMVVAEPAGDLVQLAQLSGGQVTIGEGGSVGSQAAWLGKGRLLGAQRRAMATRTTQVQGNQYLQRAVAPGNGEEARLSTLEQISADAVSFVRGKEIGIPALEEVLPEAYRLIPIAEEFLTQVVDDAYRWRATAARMRGGDYLKPSGAFWSKQYRDKEGRLYNLSENDPRSYLPMRITIQQQLLKRRQAFFFIEILRDMFDDHTARGDTASLWVITDALGVKVEPGLHPYRLNVLWQGGIAGGLGVTGGLSIARVAVQKWSKDRRRVIWQDDFLFKVLHFGLGAGAKLGKLRAKASKQPWMERVCKDMSISYEGESDWSTFDTTLNWTPEDFGKAWLGFVEGPTARIFAATVRTDGFMTINSADKGVIEIELRKFEWALSGVGADLIKFTIGWVSDESPKDTQRCDPERISIDPGDLNIPEVVVPREENEQIQYRIGKWQASAGKESELRGWLLSPSIRSMLADPSSRLAIIGHASPFWATATTYDEMIEKNKVLSQRRADYVAKLAKRTLRDELRANIVVQGYGCDEAIRELGKPTSFKHYRKVYDTYHRADLIIDQIVVFKFSTLPD